MTMHVGPLRELIGCGYLLGLLSTAAWPSGGVSQGTSVIASMDSSGYHKPSCADSPQLGSDLIEGRAHPAPAAVEHMGVNHRGRNIGVPQQLLHGADVVARLEHVSRK